MNTTLKVPLNQRGEARPFTFMLPIKFCNALIMYQIISATAKGLSKSLKKISVAVATTRIILRLAVLDRLESDINRSNQLCLKPNVRSRASPTNIRSVLEKINSQIANRIKKFMFLVVIGFRCLRFQINLHHASKA